MGQASAKDQGLDVMGGGTDESFCAHGSPLSGTRSSRDGILDAQKLEIREVRRCVFFLHGCAADAARIASIGFAAGLDQDFASAGGIGAMPEFPCFHDHGGRSFFDCGLGGDAEKAQRPGSQ
jgi:hypothetical protein